LSLNASQELKDYLFLQTIAHLAAEKEARGNRSVLQFARDWLAEPVTKEELKVK